MAPLLNKSHYNLWFHINKLKIIEIYDILRNRPINNRNHNTLYVHELILKNHLENIMAANPHSLQSEANIDQLNNAGITSLILAICHSEVKKVKNLIKKCANINQTDNKGASPLHWAVYYGQIKIISALIKKGANINQPDLEGESPLHWAIQCGDRKIVNALIKRGANVRLPDNEGKSPLHWAAYSSCADLSVCPNYIETIRALISAGADVNQPDNEGKRPLHWAAQYGHIKIVGLVDIWFVKAKTREARQNVRKFEDNSNI